MEQIAFIVGDTLIYWRPLLLCAGALTAVFFFLAFYLRRPGRALAAVTVIPLATVLSIVLARLVHWYCRPEVYQGLETALTDYSSGSFALLGVFAGCLIAALVVRLLGISDSAPAMLDAMSIAGGAGIAVGRLASFFDTTDRGPLLQTLRELPWAYPTVNIISGDTEYRLAVFLIQAMIAGGLFLILGAMALLFGRKLRDGTCCLLFLLFYSASQIVLDSCRYDHLAFRSNGFVSVIQVVSALALVFAVTVFSLRLIRRRGMKLWCISFWVLIAAALGCAGYMEYYVQRHGSLAVFSYSIMSGCLGAVCLTAVVMAVLAGLPARSKAPAVSRDPLPTDGAGSSHQEDTI